MTQAGFDLTEIQAKYWQQLIDDHDLTFEATPKGWTWYQYADIKGSRNFVITANNPITGEYHGGGREHETDYASYIGIEGTSEFVTKVFNFIKVNAEYYKSADFGSRNYI